MSELRLCGLGFRRQRLLLLSRSLSAPLLLLLRLLLAPLLLLLPELRPTGCLSTKNKKLACAATFAES